MDDGRARLPNDRTISQRSCRIRIRDVLGRQTAEPRVAVAIQGSLTLATRWSRLGARKGIQNPVVLKSANPPR
jgi:hypothetical protein